MKLSGKMGLLLKVRSHFIFFGLYQIPCKMGFFKKFEVLLFSYQTLSKSHWKRVFFKKSEVPSFFSVFMKIPCKMGHLPKVPSPLIVFGHYQSALQKGILSKSPKSLYSSLNWMKVAGKMEFLQKVRSMNFHLSLDKKNLSREEITWCKRPNSQRFQENWWKKSIFFDFLQIVPNGF